MHSLKPCAGALAAPAQLFLAEAGRRSDGRLHCRTSPPGSMLLVSASCFILIAAGAAPPPLLTLKQGRLLGALDEKLGVQRFLGVPFAEPPIGPRRWQPPAPRRAWAGTRPALSYSDSCAQSSNFFDSLAPGSEDCLYLNIFIPARRATVPRPVMVFFYGGSDETGSAMSPLYTGGNLVARTEDLVVITVNYRLNAFGWLGGDLLRGSDNSTGNWGLQDQRLAVEFVRSNAAALGIDLRKVMIFGESAGAANTGAHLVSHRSRGLFSRAAMESGPPSAVWTSQSLSRANARLEALATNAGCSGASIASCLRALNTSQIMAADHSLPPGAFPGLIDWSAVADGVEFSDQLRVLVDQGHIAPVPVLLGTNRNEGSTFTKVPTTGNMSDYEKWLTKNLGATPAQREQILHAYPPSQFLRTPYGSAAWWASSAVVSDYAMTCPAERTARQITRQGGQAFRYFFDEKLSLVDAIEAADKKPLGVFHGSELVLVFGQEELLLEAKEKELSQAVMLMWSNFARHGDPTPGSGGVGSNWTWPAFGSDGATLGLGMPPRVLRGLRRPQCELWGELGVIEPKG